MLYLLLCTMPLHACGWSLLDVFSLAPAPTPQRGLRLPSALSAHSSLADVKSPSQRRFEFDIATLLESLDFEAGCWGDAHTTLLGQTCKGLSYERKARVAVSLTTCHMSKAGIEVTHLECPDSAAINTCASRIGADPAAFSTYTLFLTHVDDICHHFQRELFEAAATMASDRLFEASAASLERLDSVLATAEQAQQVHVQLISGLETLSSDLDGLSDRQQSAFDDAAEQQLLLKRSQDALGASVFAAQLEIHTLLQTQRDSLEDASLVLFELVEASERADQKLQGLMHRVLDGIDRLIELDFSVLVEIGLLGTAVFYVSALFLALALTAAERTKAARPLVVAEALLACGLEMQFPPENRHWLPEPQTLRSMILTLMATTVCVCYCLYQDYVVIGHTLAMENNLLLRELLARSDHLMLPGDNGKGDAHYHHHHQVHAGARAQLLGFERRASPLGAPGHAAARVSCTFGAVVSSIWAAVSDRLICLRLHCVGVTEAREGAVSEAEVGEAAKASARPAAAARVNVRARAGLGARAAEEPVSRTPVQVQERVFRVQPKRRCASISQGKN